MKSRVAIVILWIAAVGATNALAKDSKPVKVRDCKWGVDMSAVPLVWKPTGEVERPNVVTIIPGTAGIPATRIEVKPFTDPRESPKRIGENREKVKRGCVFPVITRDDVSAWAADSLRALLAQLGFNIVESDGDVTLSGELRQFFVIETSNYDGEIGLKLDVTTKDGRALWSGMVTGKNGHFGRSYNLENYHETLSDAMLDLAESLAADSGFVRAVGAAP